MAHVAEYKKKIVTELETLMLEYPIIGAVNMENLPTAQLQKMRSQLRGKVVIRMTKRRLMKIAISQVKDKINGIEKIQEHLIGMPALIFTKDNPFNLFKTLKKNKSKAPAKAGQVAPNDIKISAGPTSFAPGPIIGELGQIGLKTGVEGGKVTIKEDKVVVNQGEVIKPKVAEVLLRLGIEPMEVGLNLVAILENGNILTKDILDIDEEEYKGRIFQASLWSYNLAMEIGLESKSIIADLVGKAHRQARSIVISQKILTKDMAGDVFAAIERETMMLKEILSL